MLLLIHINNTSNNFTFLLHLYGAKFWNKNTNVQKEKVQNMETITSAK